MATQTPCTKIACIGSLPSDVMVRSGQPFIRHGEMLCRQSSHRPRAGARVTDPVTPYIPDAPRNCQIKFLVINCEYSLIRTKLTASNAWLIVNLPSNCSILSLSFLFRGLYQLHIGNSEILVPYLVLFSTDSTLSILSKRCFIIMVRSLSTIFHLYH